MHLSDTRRALAVASLALTEMDRLIYDPWLGGSDDEDISLAFEMRLVSALALARRVGTVLDREVQGHRGPGFAEWWDETSRDDRIVALKKARDVELKKGRRAFGGVTTIFRDDISTPPGDMGPSVTVLSQPSAVSDLIRTYLSWVECELIPEAESRTT